MKVRNPSNAPCQVQFGAGIQGRFPSQATRPGGHATVTPTVTAAAPHSRNRTGKPQPKPVPLAKTPAK